MMWALIKKDWRLNRATVIGALVVSIMPYFLTIVNRWVDAPKYESSPGYRYPDIIASAGLAGLLFTVILCAAFGGVAFAAERRERTAEFLGVIPVSRQKIVLSKLVVAWACILTTCFFHLFVIFLCLAPNLIGLTGAGAIRGSDVNDLCIAASTALAFAITLFGIAWTLSIFIDSPAIAACIALGVGVGLYFGGTAWMLRFFAMFSEQTHSRSVERYAIFVTSVLAAIASMIAIAVSSVRYIRRSAP